MTEKANMEDLQKALTALQDIAKGHSSKGTKTTEVESMRDASAGAGGSSGGTQIYHTPSNSDRSSWAGSSWNAVGEDGASDSVDANGTDYKNQGKVMKSIMDKLAKGHQLTAAEFALLKGFMGKDEDKEMDKAKSEEDKDMEKGKPPFPPKGKGKDGDDDEDDMGKSLADFAVEDDNVSKGLEVSEFLAGFAGVISKSQQAMEERIVGRLGSQMHRDAQGTEAFYKSLADSIVALGEAVVAVTQRLDQIESQPAAAPKSIGNIHVIEKGGFGGPQGEPLNKALVASTLVDLVSKGEASVQDVVKFESSGELPAHLEHKVRTAVGR